MAKKHKIFGYSELMNALDGALSKELIAGVIILALDSWRAKVLTDFSMTAILQKCNDRIRALGGNPYEVRP